MENKKEDVKINSTLQSNIEEKEKLFNSISEEEEKILEDVEEEFDEETEDYWNPGLSLFFINFFLFNLINMK
jgi:hypothetical protein